MFSLAAKGIVSALLAGTITCGLASAVRADDTADMTALEQVFKTQRDAHQWVAAEATARKGLAIAQRINSAHDKIFWLALIGRSLSNQGKYTEAIAPLKQSLDIDEKLVGPDDPDIAISLENLAADYFNLKRFAEAEPLYERAIKIREKSGKPENKDLANVLAALGKTYSGLEKHAQAETVDLRALRIREKLLGAAHVEVASDLNNLAVEYTYEGKYAEADRNYRRALSIREAALGSESIEITTTLDNLGWLYSTQNKFSAAEPFYLRELKIREKALGPEHLDVAKSLVKLAALYRTQARFSEAEPLFLRALKIREKSLGPEHLDVAEALFQLARLDNSKGNYAQSEPLYVRALAIREKVLGPDHPDVATTLSGLAMVYKSQGKYAEAEPLYERAVNLYEKNGGPKKAELAAALNNLAALYHDQGKYALAEPLYQRALNISEQLYGSEHTLVAQFVDNIAALYRDEGKISEAEPLTWRALVIREKLLGAEHPSVAESLINRAEIFRRQERYAEAEPLCQRALKIYEKAFGPEHQTVATSLNSLARLYVKQQKFAEAEPLYQRALAIREKVFGPENPTVTQSLADLARLYVTQGKDAEAEPLVDRVIQILDRAKVQPSTLFNCQTMRAQMSWKAGRRDEAIADLRSALDLAEQIRGQGSGAEQDRAQLFSRFGSAFETMLAWQVELGSGGEALAALERGRSRSLLDELAMSGHDLSVGRSATEREKLVKQEADLRARIATLEKQIEAARDGAEKSKVQTNLAAAREALVQFHRDERAASPIYRNLLSVGASPLRLSQLQRKLLGNGGLLWAYWLGENDSYLLAITADKVRMYKLQVTEELAKALDLKAGPLTANSLSAALLAGGKSCFLAQLKNPKLDVSALAKLNALWTLLVPEVERQAALGPGVERLIVLPDGPLANLPFESLIVESGEEPVYLLDKGPPITYAPSATVLYNLAERPESTNNRDNKPVFTLGDPTYSGNAKSLPADSPPLETVTAVSRYGELGGKLSPLPHTATESAWIAENFRKAGIASSQFLKANATEQNVRQNIAGRKMIHLACHGLVDQSYGNFFGALALTPGPKGNADPNDDGYLTLPEIYDLDLKGTELAILSACETNLGPAQKGEGIWALSRGFMVAGSRRVLATDWLVDDEASANLVSYFTAGIAKQQKEATKVDYAASLQSAKRWVRQQSKWSAPYYWAPFVMIGPK